jgi:hypothetical protein
MNLVGTILLLTLSVPHAWQNRQKEVSFTVTLEETVCAPTRRLRCHYEFVEVSGDRQGKDKRHFNILFYLGADQSEEKEDAISRLDRLFNIKREVSPPGLDSMGTIGYKKPVTLRIEGSKYEFSREDAQKIVVDIEKKTRP